MARIICLANSRKEGNRCVAGLTEKGVWIRPVSDRHDEAITRVMRLIGGNEPQLRDILEIPVEAAGPTSGNQPENRRVKPGEWTKVGVANIPDLLKFCVEKEFLLHTDSDRVPESLIRALSLKERRSLQLIRVADLGVYTKTNVRGRSQVRATFTYSGRSYDIVVTDPIAEERARKSDHPARNSILCVSMAGPYEDGNLYKFVAGVIETE